MPTLRPAAGKRRLARRAAVRVLGMIAIRLPVPTRPEALARA